MLFVFDSYLKIAKRIVNLRLVRFAWLTKWWCAKRLWSSKWIRICSHGSRWLTTKAHWLKSKTQWSMFSLRIIKTKEFSRLMQYAHYGNLLRYIKACVRIWCLNNIPKLKHVLHWSILTMKISDISRIVDANTRFE